jgi:HPt (histidine-containing phosphotransfer) domain-containing protein
MDGYVAKPIKADELYAIIAQCRPTEEAPSGETLAPPLDLAAALTAADGESDLVQELIELLLAEAPSQLAMLHTALEHGDAHQLERTAHSLKGGLGTVGATRAHALVQQLEAHGRAAQFEGALTLVQQLDTELARLSAFWVEIHATDWAPVMSR